MKSENGAKKLIRKANKIASDTTLCWLSSVCSELLNNASKSEFRENMKSNVILSKNGIPIELRCSWSTHLPKEQTDWIFDLFQRNMRDLYVRSQWGYDAHAKKQELESTTARFLLLQTYSEPIRSVGYVHYRYVIENGHAVLYCYEIQFEPEFQHCGLGSALLLMLEELARRTSIEKIMCTVLEFNEPSLAFFKKNLFEKDEEMCPEKHQGLDYYILRKFVT